MHGQQNIKKTSKLLRVSFRYACYLSARAHHPLYDKIF